MSFEQTGQTVLIIRRRGEFPGISGQTPTPGHIGIVRNVIKFVHLPVSGADGSAHSVHGHFVADLRQISRFISSPPL